MGTVLMQLCGIATSMSVGMPPQSYATTGPEPPVTAEVASAPTWQHPINNGRENLSGFHWKPPKWVTADQCVEQLAEPITPVR